MPFGIPADQIPFLNPTTFEAILTAIMYGADKIPDSWFEKVPGGFYGKKEKDKGDKEMRRRDRRARRKSEADRMYDDYDDDAYYSDDGNNDRRRRRADVDGYEDDEDSERDHHRRPRRKSMGVARDYNGPRYEEPVPGAGYMPSTRYNPADYRRDDFVERAEYYTGRPQAFGGDGTRFVSPIVPGAGPGVAAARYADSPHMSSATSGPIGPYIPYAHIYGDERQQADQTRFQREAQHRPYPDPYPNPHAARVSDYTSSEPHHSHASDASHRHRPERDGHYEENKPRHHPRARSSVRDRFDTTDKGLGYGTIGALAGSIAGSQVGRGGILPTAAGAVAGGLSANAQDKDSRRAGKYDDHHHDRYDDGRRDNRHSHHRRRRDDYYSD